MKRRDLERHLRDHGCLPDREGSADRDLAPRSPHTGTPLEPLVSTAADHGIRLVTYVRPGSARKEARVG